MTAAAPVPLVDLQIQHRQVQAEVEAGFARVMERGAFVLGEDVARFEESYARFSGFEHCVGVANGTDALELMLRAGGVGRGDEVLLPVNTFIATALAVERCGATPIFVDCDPAFGLIDVSAAEAAIGERTRALLPVHLFGQLAPLAALEEVAERHSLQLFEDAAQSQGASQAGRRSAATSVAAGTSFYPGKNLGAYGDAGAVMTHSDTVATRLRELRNYGSEVKYEHPRIGFNSRLDALQAVVLNAKLAHLEEWNAERRVAAARYAALLKDDEGILLPSTAPGNESVWHLYVVQVLASERDRVLSLLHENGIGAGIHYPVPLHLCGAFAGEGRGSVGRFPVAEARAKSMLSLPLFPGIREAQQERVAEVLRAALA